MPAVPLPLGNVITRLGFPSTSIRWFRIGPALRPRPSIGHVDIKRDTAIFRPFGGQRVCTATTAGNYSAKRPIGMETIELRINRGAVVKIPTAAYEDLRLI
jgi:hypothetical protein